MADFRQATRNGATALGTFIKTASHQIVEVLGHAGLDAIIDGARRGERSQGGRGGSRDGCRGRRHGRAIGIYVGDTSEIAELMTLGITIFVCGSDQSLLLAQARRLRKELNSITETRTR